MHRHRIRAFVTTAGEFDVPVAIFAPGQFLRFISPAVGILSSSLGPGTSTINALATWGDTTGTQLLNTSVLLDSSGNMTNLVTLDAQDAPNITAKTGTDPAVGEITVWASAAAPWKLGRRVVTVNTTGDVDNVNTLNGRIPAILVGKSPTSAPSTNSVMVSADGTGVVARGTPVLIDSSGNITGVLSINSVTPGTWVSGPASSVNNRLATFNGTTGKIIQDASGITATGNALGSVDFINGNAVFSGPASSTTNGIPRFTAANIVANSTATVDASGNVVVTTLNAVNPSTWVVGPAGSTDNRIAVFSGTTGKLIKDGGGVAIDSSGNITGVGNISAIQVNSINPSTWVVGPSSATSGGLAVFSGTTGKLIASGVTITASGGTLSNVTGINSLTVGSTTISGLTGLNSITVGTTTLAGITTINSVDPASWVQGPSSATDNRVALFNSTTGKLIKQSAVTIDASGNTSGVGTIAAGNITAGTYNTVTVQAHATRHTVGGADTVFPGNYTSASPQARSYFPCWNGSGTFVSSWIATLTNNNSNVTTTSYTWTQYVPSVSTVGYIASWVIAVQPGDSSNLTVTVVVGSGSGRWCMSVLGIDSGAAVGSSLTASSATSAPMVLRVDGYLEITGATSNSYALTITAATAFTVAAFPMHRISEN